APRRAAAHRPRRARAAQCGSRAPHRNALRGLSPSHHGSVRFLPSLPTRRSGGTNDMGEGATMARRTGWSLLAAAAATLVVAGACNDSQSPKPRALLGLPDVGTLAGTVTTSGPDTPGGFTIVVAGPSSQSAGANAVATFLAHPPGSPPAFHS